jgi:hypothetical protein
MEYIQIETLFDDQLRPNFDPATRLAIADAEVVIAVDKASQSEYTVFGTPALEETIRIGQEVALPTVCIEFRDAPGQLEKLVSLVQSIKRGQDHLASDD